MQTSSMGIFQKFTLFVLLMAAFALAWLYSQANDKRETIRFAPKTKFIVLDGDSFRIGKQGYRLQGIDAPEYRQNCSSLDGQPWQCGKASRGNLESLLSQPGLQCETEYQDKYRRMLATCKTNPTADIAAAQVAAGMAMSDEYYGLQSYGSEEAEAREAKRGIWQGSFMLPSDWRDANLRR